MARHESDPIFVPFPPLTIVIVRIYVCTSFRINYHLRSRERYRYSFCSVRLHVLCPPLFFAIPGKYITFPTQNFTIGSDRLNSPVCPVDVTDGPYPWYCPTPLSIDAGVISFSYVRNDIAPPVSILEEFNETGVDPYANTTSKPGVGAWAGPGYILSPALSNPDIVLPLSSFWENDRVGYFFTTDGSTWSNIDCGNGVSVQELLLGDTVAFDGAGPVTNPETETIMQCSPRTDAWKEYASMPKSWDENNYCPNEIFADYETYIDYNYDKVLTYLSSMTVTKEDCETFFAGYSNTTIESLDFYKNQTEFNLSGQCSLLLGSPQAVTCGIPPSKFDSIYIPAQKYKNWPKERQNLTKQGYPAFATGYREVAVKPWHGLGFPDFGQHMVFYGDYGDEESIQTALEHAKDFYEKSQMNGATPIRIPVVVMNPDNMWLQGDDDYNTSSSAQQQPPPFTCPSSTNDNNGTDNRTGTRIGNGNGNGNGNVNVSGNGNGNGNGNGDDAVSSSGSSTNNVFNIGNNIITAALLSVAYIIASVH